jgi:hypothetical protein
MDGTFQNVVSANGTKETRHTRFQSVSASTVKPQPQAPWTLHPQPITYKQQVGENGTNDGGFDDLDLIVRKRNNRKNKFDGISKGSVQQSTKVLII